MGPHIKRILLVGLAVILLVAVGIYEQPTDAARLNQYPTPTPSPSPVRSINYAEITSPKPGAVVFGVITIQGTALIEDYIEYQVHISVHGLENWSWLVTSFEIVRDGTLYTLDTTRFPDGFYDLRVRAIRRDGNYNEAFVRKIEIRNTNPPTPIPTILSPGSPLATPSPLRTPTPTPDFSSYVPGGQGIYEPKNNQVVRGYVEIIGTANAPDIYHRFRRYELYVSPAGQEKWSWLFTSATQHFQERLYILDTTRLANGYYDLRLRIVYKDSNYNEYFVRNLQVANHVEVTEPQRGLVVIKSPRSNSTVYGQVDIVGTVLHPDFQRWELYWSPGGNNQWSFLFSADYQVVDELIARVDLSPLPVGAYDFLLRVVHKDGNYDDYPIRRLHVVIPTPTPLYPSSAPKPP
jgi:hypothetical protein